MTNVKAPEARGLFLSYPSYSGRRQAIKNQVRQIFELKINDSENEEILFFSTNKSIDMFDFDYKVNMAALQTETKEQFVNYMIYENKFELCKAMPKRAITLLGNTFIYS